MNLTAYPLPGRELYKMRLQTLEPQVFRGQNLEKKTLGGHGLGFRQGDAG
jgi:hypothetical protein